EGDPPSSSDWLQRPLRDGPAEASSDEEVAHHGAGTVRWRDVASGSPFPAAVNVTQPRRTARYVHSKRSEPSGAMRARAVDGALTSSTSAGPSSRSAAGLATPIACRPALVTSSVTVTVLPGSAIR